MKGCDTVREILPEVAAGAQSAEARAHVDACDACRAELDDLRAILAASETDLDPLPETRARRLVLEDLGALADIRRRAVRIVGAALATTALLAPLVLLVHVRPDLGELPRAFLVTSIVLLVLLGATGLLLATRVSGLSRGAAAAFVVLAAASFVAFAFAMPSGPSSLVPLPGLDTLRHMVPCFVVASIHAVLPLGLAALLLARARFFPAPAAVTLGVGAGLLGIPVVELFCPISVTSHILVAHGGAVVLATLLSTIALRGMERRRLG